jgi:hypothetical protein
MKCVFKIILIALCCSLQWAVHAQTAARYNGNYYNLEKYWFYRYRLINDFMKIGPNCGESLPFAERKANYWNTVFDSSLYTGGEVPIHLGDYIGALATEHRLLANNLLSTTRTDYELGLALNAFERMDRNAEQYTLQFYNYNFYDTLNCALADQSLNGYFIRDDVPYTRFIPQNWNHFNRPGSLTKLKTNARTSSALGRYDELILPPSDPNYWYRPGWKNICVPHEESKDGTINLSMGFALTSKLLGVSNPLGFKAAENLHRMIEYIDLGSKPFGSGGFGHKPWTIVNPISDRCVFGDEWDNNPCDGGGWYLECVYGAAESSQKWGFPSSSALLTDASPFKPLWHLSQWYTAHTDYNFWGNYGALANNWYLLPLGTAIPWIGGLLPSGAVNMTWTRMKQFATAQNDGQPHLPYLYRVMYPGKGTIFMPIETQIKLDVAPPCGPHNYYGNFSNGRDYSGSSVGTYLLNGDYAWHWSGPNLIHSYYSKEKFHAPGIVLPINKNEHADYNGIDYMLLFNLYSLQDFYLLWMFNSYYKENFSLNFPDKVGTPQETGSYYRQLKLNFLEYVSAINKVESNGYFTMRCAKAIDLKPGFEAKSGSRFLAYIADYSIDCGDKESNRPSEEYHYAEINQKPGWVFQPQGILPQSQNDTSYYLDFPPDGVAYIPDSSALIGTEDDTVSCEVALANFDSLVAYIYASGDPEQIAYIDSLIPYVSFPECDSTAAASSMAPSGTGMDGSYTQAVGRGSYAAHLVSKLLDKEKDGTDFNVFPNPNNGHFTFAFGAVGEYDIKIYNPVGVLIFQTHVYSRRSEVVHIDGLPNGVYTAEVVNSKGAPNKKIRKIVITQ